MKTMETHLPEKNKGGRPRIGAEVKRAPLNMKTSPDLRAKIEQAAAESGLSMSQEVERRLEQSFSEEERLGGKETAALARAIASNINWVEQAQGSRWYAEDDVCFLAVAQTIPLIMERCRKTPRLEVIDDFIKSAAVKLAFDSVAAFDGDRLSDYDPAASGT